MKHGVVKENVESRIETVIESFGDSQSCAKVNVEESKASFKEYIISKTQ